MTRTVKNNVSVDHWTNPMGGQRRQEVGVIQSEQKRDEEKAVAADQKPK